MKLFVEYMLSRKLHVHSSQALPISDRQLACRQISSGGSARQLAHYHYCLTDFTHVDKRVQPGTIEVVNDVCQS